MLIIRRISQNNTFLSDFKTTHMGVNETNNPPQSTLQRKLVYYTG
jgi:hypothetical protein